MGTSAETYKSSFVILRLFSFSSIHISPFSISIRCNNLHCAIWPSSTGCKLCSTHLWDQRTDECAATLKILRTLAMPIWHYSKKPTYPFRNTTSLPSTAIVLSAQQPHRHLLWPAQPKTILIRLSSTYHSSSVSLCTHFLFVYPINVIYDSHVICVNFFIFLQHHRIFLGKSAL